MSYFRWATLMGVAFMLGTVGCSGSSQVATNDSETSSSENGNSPSRSARPNRRVQTAESKERQPSNANGNINQGSDIGGNQNANAAAKNTRSNIGRGGSQVGASNGSSNANKRRQPSMGGGGGRSNASASTGNDNPKKRAGNTAGSKPKNTLTKATPTGKKGTNPGDELPEITGRDMDGNAFKLSDYRGKVIMVDFWGDW